MNSNQNNTITTLSEDIQQIIKEKQREKFELLRLCRDHGNKVLLHDKKSVLDITQDDLVGVFDMKSNHYFLNPEQVFRLAMFSRLPVSAFIGILLKAEWEILFSEILKITGNNLNDLESHFKNKKLVEKHISDFFPNRGKIKNMFIRYEAEQKPVFELDKIDFLIDDLLKEHFFLTANKKVCLQYDRTNSNENALLLDCSAEEKQKYFELKELWKYKTGELSDYLFRLEREKRAFTNLENRYLRIFGSLELKKLQWDNRVKKYNSIIRLIKEYPSSSFRELLKNVNEIIDKTEREKSELRSKINRSHSVFDISFFPGSSTPVVTKEFRSEYIKECKRLLRKVYLLLHPDRPGYSGLNETKKKSINRLWLKLMKTTSGEVHSYSPSMFLYQYPDLEVLKDIYLTACKILGITPDESESGDRLEFMISKGTSFQKIIHFLTEEIEKTDLHLARLELVQNEYSHHLESEYCRNALENVHSHQKRLNKEIDELKDTLVTLKNEISNRLIKQRA